MKFIQILVVLNLKTYLVINSLIVDVFQAKTDLNKPMGISEYRLTESIPDQIKGNLPSIEELENKLGEIEQKKKNE